MCELQILIRMCIRTVCPESNFYERSNVGILTSNIAPIEDAAVCKAAQADLSIRPARGHAKFYRFILLWSGVIISQPISTIMTMSI